MIDRSRYDEQTDASLNIIQAAANLALVHENRLLSETAADLASDLYAMTDRYDEALAALVRLNDQAEATEALGAERLKVIHVQAREAAKLRAALAVRDLELGKVRAQTPQKRRNRIRWYHRAGALTATAAATLIVAAERAGSRSARQRSSARPLDSGVRLALLVLALGGLAIIVRFGV